MGYVGGGAPGNGMIAQNEANSWIARRGQMGGAWYAPYKAGPIVQNEANLDEAGQESGSIMQNKAIAAKNKKQRSYSLMDARRSSKLLQM